MTSKEIQERIEKVESINDGNRLDFQLPKYQTLATLEVALQLARMNERNDIEITGEPPKIDVQHHHSKFGGHPKTL